MEGNGKASGPRSMFLHILLSHDNRKGINALGWGSLSRLEDCARPFLGSSYSRSLLSLFLDVNGQLFEAQKQNPTQVGGSPKSMV